MAISRKDIKAGPVRFRCGVQSCCTFFGGGYLAMVRFAYSSSALFFWLFLQVMGEPCKVPLRTAIALVAYQGTINATLILLATWGVTAFRCLRADMPKAYRSYFRTIVWFIASTFVVVSEMGIAAVMIVLCFADLVTASNGNWCGSDNVSEFLFFLTIMIAEIFCALFLLHLLPFFNCFSCVHSAKVEKKKKNFEGRGMMMIDPNKTLIRKNHIRNVPGMEGIDVELGQTREDRIYEGGIESVEGEPSTGTSQVTVPTYQIHGLARKDSKEGSMESQTPLHPSGEDDDAATGSNIGVDEEYLLNRLFGAEDDGAGSAPAVVESNGNLELEEGDRAAEEGEKSEREGSETPATPSNEDDEPMTSLKPSRMPSISVDV